MRPEQVPARPECPEPGRWSAPDSDATETDISALIGAFVTALKPDYVVETGAYLGDTSAQIGYALQMMGRGRLLSIELSLAHAATARARVAGLPVTVAVGKAEEVIPEQPIDLLFVDSGLEDRMREVRVFRPYALPRCVILAHDSAMPVSCPGVSDFYAAMNAVVDEGLVYPWVKLPTPRGLAITRYR